ncbi:SDR family oxidoreductase [uncultured Desulfosarcina sp.]|uniref:SDR family oxidoreductase n=1 Tax=uncultured Desulfosarcina sp. TaxID=218289 RepID=UPI0029C7A66A|nr:SDR family oxidoreductase [uncultured Desulfosarcina sp.]
MKDKFDILDKIIVITGGLGQLGLQYAAELLERNARIAIFDLPESAELNRNQFDLLENSKRFLYCQVNVTDKNSIESGLNKVIKEWGIPHGLINNAALDSPPHAPISENGPFETYPESSWDKIMEVNAKGVLLMCQVIGGAMAEAKRGSIVNISSIYGIVSPDHRIYNYRRKTGETFYKPIAYSASKSTILNMTRYMATYWAPKGVRVNTITLGGVYNNQEDEFIKEYSSKVPLGRMADPDEYNGAIVFLISDASSYMTGSNLIIDGGWTAW